MTRIKESFGSYHVNKGERTVFDESRFDAKKIAHRQFYLFDVIPMGGVRMSSSDRWKTNPNHLDPRRRQREVVARYFAYKDALRFQAEKMGFEMGDFIEGIYFSPMPDSWSEKKKTKLNGFPCKVKPDTDNITKGLKDTFSKSDSNVWKDIAEHRWAYNGSIILFG